MRNTPVVNTQRLYKSQFANSGNKYLKKDTPRKISFAEETLCERKKWRNTQEILSNLTYDLFTLRWASEFSHIRIFTATKISFQHFSFVRAVVFLLVTIVRIITGTTRWGFLTVNRWVNHGPRTPKGRKFFILARSGWYKQLQGRVLGCARLS